MSWLRDTDIQNGDVLFRNIVYLLLELNYEIVLIITHKNSYNVFEFAFFNSIVQYAPKLVWQKAPSFRNILWK